MMQPRLFSAKSDMAELNKWHQGHGLGSIRAGALPQVGLVVPGVAAGFLYSTDSDLAFLDGYTTNPRATLRARSKAIDVITNGLVQFAHDVGFRQVLAYCKPSTARRAFKRHGFAILDSHVLAVKETA